MFLCYWQTTCLAHRKRCPRMLVRPMQYFTFQVEPPWLNRRVKRPGKNPFAH
jgi:hypothetical protein